MQGYQLVEQLLTLCEIDEKPERITIAIDATLGWPQAMRNLINEGEIIEISEIFRENRYLFRRTDRWLSERGFIPLSAVKDMIGSQSTKAIHFLKAAGLHPHGVGVWKATLDGCEVTAIETYPAPCNCSDVFRKYYEPLEAELPDRADSDIPDALRCSIIAHMFSEHPELLCQPENDVPAREGWIWIPEDAEAK